MADNKVLKGGENQLSSQVDELIQQQVTGWDLALKNYSGLKTIRSKTLQFDGFQVKAQFNPERIRSSAAKTDAKSIQQRACFLCERNRPEEQKKLLFKNRYSILINPFPIFDKHLTIPLNEHQPQEIEPYFADMLHLSKQLPEFTIFYNGPQCGASAPDHFHFQAGSKNQMPVDAEIKMLKNQGGETLFQNDHTTISAIGNQYLRKLIGLQSNSETDLTSHFKQVLSFLNERGQAGEPMLNLLATFENGFWQLMLFSRDRQRPSQFFETGDRQLLISPASVEMGGLVILPREEDFEKITKSDLIDIYRQVTINDQDFEILKNKLRTLEI